MVTANHLPIFANNLNMVDDKLVLINEVEYFIVHVLTCLCCVLLQEALRVWPEGDHQADGEDELCHHGTKYRSV